MREGAKEKIKKRASYITVLGVIIVFVIIGVILSFIYHFIINNKKEERPSYISNLLEEDKMQYEYKHINEELAGVYSFGISENKLVAINGKQETVSIYELNIENNYQYYYLNKHIYLLEKETGEIKLISLKEGNGNYIVNETIDLREEVSCFEITNKGIYYIAKNALKLYNNEQIEIIYNDVTAEEFVIKNGVVFIVRNNTLVKIDGEIEENIANNVVNVSYYNYYEKDKLIFTIKTADSYKFKSVYNFYTGVVKNSIKNDSYFIPYLASNYLYLSDDRKSIVYINKAESISIFYKSDEEINALNYLYKDQLQVITDNENIVLDLKTKKIEEKKNIVKLENIYYVKNI